MRTESTDLFYENGNEIVLNDKVRLVTGIVGEVVYKCGAYGVAFDHIDYDQIQQTMDSLSRCCGNNFSGCRNDNFISLWELYWNFNCEENTLCAIEKLNSKEY